MAATFTTGNDTAALFETFASINNSPATYPLPGTWDALAGNDTLDVWDQYNGHFTVTMSAAGVITLSNASGALNLKNFEQITYHGSSNVVHHIVAGTTGADALLGTAGLDVIAGNGGNDTLNGGAGNDTLVGGAGNDVYIVGAGDKVFETTTTKSSTNAGGSDLVKSGVSYTLGSFLENLTLTGNAAAGTGNGQSNVLTGNTAGNTLSGLAGADKLIGGNGNDVLYGGGGADTFVFNFMLNVDPAKNVDSIKDYDTGGVADKIFLDDDVFIALGPVNTATPLAASQFFAGTSAHDSSDRIIYDKVSGKLYYDADGTGTAEKPVLFAVLTTKPTLDASDFFVVA